MCRANRGSPECGSPSRSPRPRTARSWQGSSAAGLRELENWSRRIHVDEVGWRLRVLRGLRRHVIAHATGEPVAQLWPTARSDVDAWEHFAWHANAALQPFHVRVCAVDHKGQPVGISGLPLPTAYEAAVLQLVNDLMTHADYKVCAAEGCGRVFARQRDRSVHYSRTSGVVYCSRTCANTQTQREYRRRKRVERGQS
jgi:hypothetical protein